MFACIIVLWLSGLCYSGGIAFIGVRSTLCIFLSSVSMLFYFCVNKYNSFIHIHCIGHTENGRLHAAKHCFTLKFIPLPQQPITLCTVSIVIMLKIQRNH